MEEHARIQAPYPREDVCRFSKVCTSLDVCARDEVLNEPHSDAVATASTGERKCTALSAMRAQGSESPLMLSQQTAAASGIGLLSVCASGDESKPRTYIWTNLSLTFSTSLMSSSSCTTIAPYVSVNSSVFCGPCGDEMGWDQRDHSRQTDMQRNLDMISRQGLPQA